MNALEIGSGCESTMGVINEMAQRATDKADLARMLATRVHDLKVRLIGHDGQVKDGNQPSAPNPPGEVNALGEIIQSIGEALIDIEQDIDDLSRL